MVGRWFSYPSLRRGLGGGFSFDCRGSQSLATTAKPTPTLIRKVLLLLLLLRGLGPNFKKWADSSNCVQRTFSHSESGFYYLFKVVTCIYYFVSLGVSAVASLGLSAWIALPFWPYLGVSALAKLLTIKGKLTFVQDFCVVLVFQRGQVLRFIGFRTGGLSPGRPAPFP